MASDERERIIFTAVRFAISGVASVLSVSATAPLDRVRILLQCNHEINRSGRLLEPYRGVIDCTRRINRTEGGLSFWRGNVIACVRYHPEQLIYLALKDVAAKVIISENDSPAVRVSKNLTAGALGGFFTHALLYSFDYCRTRLAADILHAGTDGMRQRQFKGIFDVYRKTLRSDGIVGLHRGFMVSCMGVGVYTGAYFGLYDSLTPMLLKEDSITRFLFGYVTTVVAGVISYPLDTIRRRMMMRSCEQVKYKGWVECARYAYRNEGLLSLYGGVSINIMKGFPGLLLLLFYQRL
nr:ADP,ATP carrier protein 3, mitochondrial-like [Crassostrea gigas]